MSGSDMRFLANPWRPSVSELEYDCSNPVFLCVRLAGGETHVTQRQTAQTLFRINPQMWGNPQKQKQDEVRELSPSGKAGYPNRRAFLSRASTGSRTGSCISAF